MIFPVGSGMEIISSCNSAEPEESICELLLKSQLSSHPAPLHWGDVHCSLNDVWQCHPTAGLTFQLHLPFGKCEGQAGCPTVLTRGAALKALSTCALCVQKKPYRDLEMDHTATSPGLTRSNGLWRENGKKAQCASKFAGGCWWKWGLWCTHWSTGSWTETKSFHAGRCTDKGRSFTVCTDHTE